MIQHFISEDASLVLHTKIFQKGHMLSSCGLLCREGSFNMIESSIRKCIVSHAGVSIIKDHVAQEETPPLSKKTI